MMTENKKRAAVFFLLLLVFIAILSVVFKPGTRQRASKEARNTLDYLVVGDSESYTSVSPMEIYRNYGYTGRNYGAAAQPIRDVYYIIESVLKEQKPKVIFIETNVIYRNSGYAKEIDKSLSSILKELVPLYKYHSQWKKLLFMYSSSISSQISDPFKGMKYDTGINAYTGGDYVKPTDKVQSINPMQLIYLNMILDLCNENGVKLVLYSVPSPLCWNYKKHNGAAQYAAENALSYIDFNLMQEQINIDWSHDTFDRGDHLNFFGAQKISAYLGQYLRDTCALTDHRDDERYSRWDETLTEYLIRTNQFNQEEYVEEREDEQALSDRLRKYLTK